MLVVVMVMTGLLGATTSLIIASRSRLAPAVRTTGARFQVGRAARLLAADVRAAASAEAAGGELLLRPGAAGEPVRWLLRGDRLVRGSAAGEQVFDAAVAEFTPRAEGSLVEAGIRLGAPGGRRGGVFYASARCRAGEAGR
jgi:hypothetical protein